MAFSSLPFLLFLPGVFVVHFAVGDRHRWMVRLLASLAFYASFGSPAPLVALATVSVVSHGLGRVIAVSQGGRRSAAFWAGVAFDLAVLVVARYGPLLGQGGGLWPSIGVSYFVFQAISYLADVHLGVIEPEPRMGRFAESLAYFPKLLQGPIERSGKLLPQLRAPYRFDQADVRAGLLQFGAGLFRKVVIADRLALFVDPAYANPGAQTGATLALATYAYALQIYFDFSGYTEMALGAARVFGIRLTPNFDAPYSATSVADFWRRWHISFSSWILDYVFRPLQMLWRRRGTFGSACALLVTFLASGAWHGAAWHYLAWGLLHGLYMAGGLVWRPHEKRLLRRLGVEGSPLLPFAKRLVTFHLICLAWVLFRAPSVGAALAVLTGMLRPGLPSLSGIPFPEEHVATLAGAFLFDRAFRAVLSGEWVVADWPRPARWLVYLAMAYSCLLLAVGARGFVYQGF
jgi:D-alanyl-lipoteichoic acid acyltransferase DltB (MBOAT superfamily)